MSKEKSLESVESQASETSVLNDKMISLSSAGLKEWIGQSKESVKPWTQFFKTSRFEKPSWNPAFVGKRIINNVENYQGNYLIIFAVFAVFCILTSPLLLIGIGLLLAACYMINTRNHKTPLKLGTYSVPLVHQYLAASLASVPIFYIAGAGSTIFWLIGVTVVLIGLHASSHIPDNQFDSDELEMETV